MTPTACEVRTGVRYWRHGLPEPACAVGRAGAAAVQRPLAGRSHVERRRRQPGVVAQAPALRARRRAPGRHRALRRAALPLQLLVPRRGLPPRGAGRGGGPARPGGPGPHRPRRLLRRGALRRGGQGGRGAHGVRGRAHPQRCPLSGRLEARPPVGSRQDTSAGSRQGPADPGGHHLLVLADGPQGYADLARALSRGQMAGEKGAPRFTLEGVAEASSGHWWVLTGCRKGAVPSALVDARSGRGDEGAAAPRRGCSVASGWPWSCGTTASRSTRSATTPWPSWRCERGCSAWPPPTPTSTLPLGPGCARPWRRCGRAAASTSSIRGCPRPAATCARAPSSSAASPATPGWWRRRPRSAGPAPSTWRWSPPTCRRSPARPATPRWATCAELVHQGGERRYGPRPAPASRATSRVTAWRPRRGPPSTTSSTSSRGSGSPATSSWCGTSSSSAARPTSTARAGARRPTRRSASRSASPRPTPSASACCSSASSPPSATARPTSTSTSRAGAGRRSSSTSTSATAASTPPRWPTSSPTGPARRCATWPRPSGSRPASRTPGRSRSTPGAGWR